MKKEYLRSQDGKLWVDNQGWVYIKTDSGFLLTCSARQPKKNWFKRLFRL